MAKLATPHLKDVVPTVAALGTVVDRLIEVGVSGSPLANVRITVQDESGRLAGAVNLSVGDDNGTPFWADCTLSLDKGAGPEVTGRLNRLMYGFAIQRAGLLTVTGKKFSPPKVGKHWRTDKISMFHAGKIIESPAVGVAKPHVTSTHLSTLWTLKGHQALLVEPNAALGYAPVKATTPARPKRAARSVTPKAPKVTPPTPTPVNPSQVTPKGSPVTPQSTHIPTPKGSVLPKEHPGIFRELARKPFAVHTDPKVQRQLEAAYHGFSAKKRLTIINLRGPSGAGKTLAAMNLASAKGLPFAKFEVQGMRDFSDWFGSVSLRETDTGKVITDFVPSDFCEAVREDGPYSGIPRLVLLDEFTRAETAASQMALMAVFDGSGTVYIPDARKSIVIDPTVLFVVTANVGAGFTGTIITDLALNNRLTRNIVVDYVDADTEAKIVAEQGEVSLTVAKQLVQTATLLRGMASRGELPLGVSTRQLVRIGEAITDGLSAPEAYEVGYANDLTLSREGGASSDYSKAMTTINSVLS